jgi:putative sigma-54 modulation protein
MKLQMQSIHFDADNKLLAFIQKKADKLETFYGSIIDGEVVMRLQKDETKENKIFEMKLRIPGSQLFVKEQAKSFEAATDMAIEAMSKQLKKIKGKRVSIPS